MIILNEIEDCLILVGICFFVYIIGIGILVLLKKCNLSKIKAFLSILTQSYMLYIGVSEVFYDPVALLIAVIFNDVLTRNYVDVITEYAYGNNNKNKLYITYVGVIPIMVFVIIQLIKL